MIEDGFSYVAVLVALGGGILWMQRATGWKFFEYAPPIVLLYFGVMVLATIGLWPAPGDNAGIDSAYREVRNNLLPAMIFLMLLKSDLRQIGKLGPRMLLAFFAATLSIVLGFIVSFSLFQSQLAADAWKTFAALSGSWMGGTGNMAAIQAALQVPDASMGYTLLIDSIDYALWVVFLLALVPYAGYFNRWVGADTSVIDSVGKRLEQETDKESSNIDAPGMLFLIGLSLLVSSVAQMAATGLPTTSFVTLTTWVVIIVTVAGVIGAVTPVGRIAGSADLATVMLYVIIALIASRANFSELTQAPAYIIAGLVILAVHGTIMVILAKLLKLDLFTCGVASLANIGGVASAPILAAAYSRVLIPVGVLMAMLGYIVGTGGGLLVGRILSGIAS
ncbi:MAG: DUF819 family protein [Woeseiaceae bacterium]|nr:DUF819 family protein [Woeseiaceae bacterium]